MDWLVPSSSAPTAPMPNSPRNDRPSIFFFFFGEVPDSYGGGEEGTYHGMMPHHVLCGFFGGYRDDSFRSLSLLQQGKNWMSLRHGIRSAWGFLTVNSHSSSQGPHRHQTLAVRSTTQTLRSHPRPRYFSPKSTLSLSQWRAERRKI